MDAMVMVFVALLFYGLGIFALFWLIRLAVRHGVDDALRKNRHWLRLEASSPMPNGQEDASDIT